MIRNDATVTPSEAMTVWRGITCKAEMKGGKVTKQGTVRVLTKMKSLMYEDW